MITVYVKRFNKETDEEAHIESYEIESTDVEALSEFFSDIFKKLDYHLVESSEEILFKKEFKSLI